MNETVVHNLPEFTLFTGDIGTGKPILGWVNDEKEDGVRHVTPLAIFTSSMAQDVFNMRLKAALTTLMQVKDGEPF